MLKVAVRARRALPLRGLTVTMSDKWERRFDASARPRSGRRRPGRAALFLSVFLLTFVLATMGGCAYGCATTRAIVIEQHRLHPGELLCGTGFFAITLGYTMIGSLAGLGLAGAVGCLALLAERASRPTP